MQAAALEAYFRQWNKEAEFFVVYLSEAHPWPRKTKKKGPTILPEPRTILERSTHASKCVTDLKMTIPILIDGMDNSVGTKYAALPDRIYVIGKNGKVAYKGAPGPFGFRPPEAWHALMKLLGVPVRML